MDPNANLQEQLELVAKVFAAIPEGQANAGLPQMSVGDMTATAERLAELIEALDGWLSKGGFLPRRWSR